MIIDEENKLNEILDMIDFDSLERVLDENLIDENLPELDITTKISEPNSAIY